MPTPDLTYLEYLAVAVAPVTAVLLARAVRGAMPTRRWAGVGLMVCIALVYTTPWDNYLVAQRVWWYGEGSVLATVWHAPVGEYLFIVLQSVAAALWVYLLLERSGATVPYRLADVGRRARLAGVAGGAVVGAVGLALLTRTSSYYLGAILAWAGPVLALQWGFAWPYLVARWRLVLAGVAAPTLYFWVVDRVALELGLWVISPRYTTGVALAGLPVEEAAFFLVTTLFVVQGLVLLEWVLVETPLDAALARLGIDPAGVRTTARR